MSTFKKINKYISIWPYIKGMGWEIWMFVVI